MCDELFLLLLYVTMIGSLSRTRSPIICGIFRSSFGELLHFAFSTPHDISVVNSTLFCLLQGISRVFGPTFHQNTRKKCLQGMYISGRPHSVHHQCRYVRTARCHHPLRFYSYIYSHSFRFTALSSHRKYTVCYGVHY